MTFSPFCFILVSVIITVIIYGKEDLYGLSEIQPSTGIYQRVSDDTYRSSYGLYHQLRKIYPNISLGTIYRNLALLADIGEIQKICTGDGADRFDGQIRPHYHVICTRCHQVMDLDLDYMKEPEALAAEHFEGKILGHITNFYGICPDCLKKDTM